MSRPRAIPPRTWLYAAALLAVLKLLRREKARPAPHKADRYTEPQAQEEQPSLQVLLAVYSVERQDNATEVHTIATFVGFILAYLVGAIAVLSSTSLRPALSPGVILASPSIPVILFAWISLFVADANLRRRYLLELEAQIKAATSTRSSGASVEVPSWIAWNAKVFEPGYKPLVRLLLSAAVITVFVGAAALLVVLVFYAYLILPPEHRRWMLAIYTPSILATVVIFLSSNLWIHRLSGIEKDVS
jgi:hypothetical protein